MYLIGFIILYSVAMMGVWSLLTKKPKAPEPVTVWCGHPFCGEELDRAPNEPTGWKHRLVQRPEDQGRPTMQHEPAPVTRKPDKSK